MIFGKLCSPNIHHPQGLEQKLPRRPQQRRSRIKNISNLHTVLHIERARQPVRNPTKIKTHRQRIASRTRGIIVTVIVPCRSVVPADAEAFAQTLLTPEFSPKGNWVSLAKISDGVMGRETCQPIT
jgi:hypothetical protein